MDKLHSVSYIHLNTASSQNWGCSFACQAQLKNNFKYFLKQVKKHKHKFCQSSKRTDRDALTSMKNFLLGGAANPSPAPLLPESILRECARSNCPCSPCCSCSCASFPSAMLALPGVPDAGWKPFLKPPIKRRNFCCWSALSNWAVLHWPKPWETAKTMKCIYEK